MHAHDRREVERPEDGRSDGEHAQPERAPPEALVQRAAMHCQLVQAAQPPQRAQGRQAVEAVVLEQKHQQVRQLVQHA
eukprot:COSAG01_NODE_504_length_16140_cov_40.890967_17_plen_78_part_00